MFEDLEKTREKDIGGTKVEYYKGGPSFEELARYDPDDDIIKIIDPDWLEKDMISHELAHRFRGDDGWVYDVCRKIRVNFFPLLLTITVAHWVASLASIPIFYLFVSFLISLNVLGFTSFHYEAIEREANEEKLQYYAFVEERI